RSKKKNFTERRKNRKDKRYRLPHSRRLKSRLVKFTQQISNCVHPFLEFSLEEINYNDYRTFYCEEYQRADRMYNNNYFNSYIDSFQVPIRSRRIIQPKSEYEIQLEKEIKNSKNRELECGLRVRNLE